MQFSSYFVDKFATKFAIKTCHIKKGFFILFCFAFNCWFCLSQLVLWYALEFTALCSLAKRQNMNFKLHDLPWKNIFTLISATKTERHSLKAFQNGLWPYWLNISIALNILKACKLQCKIFWSKSSSCINILLCHLITVFTEVFFRDT